MLKEKKMAKTSGTDEIKSKGLKQFILAT